MHFISTNYRSFSKMSIYYNTEKIFKITEVPNFL